MRDKCFSGVRIALLFSLMAVAFASELAARPPQFFRDAMHGGAAEFLVVSADGRFLDTGSSQVWDLTTGTLWRTLSLRHRAVAGVPGSENVKSPPLTGTGVESSAVAAGASDCSSFSRDGTRIVNGFSGAFSEAHLFAPRGGVRLFDVSRGQELWEVDCPGEVHNVMFNSDGTRILAVAEDRAIILDASSGRKLFSFPVVNCGLHVDRYLNFLSPASFSPDGAWIVAISERATGFAP